MDKINGLEPSAYIHHVLERMTDADTVEKLVALLPRNVELLASKNGLIRLRQVGRFIGLNTARLSGSNGVTRPDKKVRFVVVNLNVRFATPASQAISKQKRTFSAPLPPIFKPLKSWNTPQKCSQ